jgi:hypothetical protein
MKKVVIEFNHFLLRVCYREIFSILASPPDPIRQSFLKPAYILSGFVETTFLEPESKVKHPF